MPYHYLWKPLKKLQELKDKIQIWFEKWFYKTYKTLDFIPVGCFFKIIETNDLRYLFKLKDYESLPKIKYSPTEIWNKLHSEYLNYSSGFSMFNYVSDYGNLITKKEIYIKLKHTAFLLSIKEDKDLIEIVKRLGYKFEYTNDIEYCEAISDLNRQLIALNKIVTRKYNEFLKKYKSDNNKPINIYEIINVFENYKGRKIDIWNTSMREFITIQASYREWVKSQKNVR